VRPCSLVSVIFSVYAMLPDAVESGNECLSVNCRFFSETGAASALPADRHVAFRDVVQGRNVV
jgi:hypothetical protein